MGLELIPGWQLSLCSAVGLPSPQDSIFLAVPEQSTSCFILAKGCYKWFHFKGVQLNLTILATSSLWIVAWRLCSSQKTNGWWGKKQTTPDISMVSSLLLISCALSRTEYLEHFTCHFQDCHISLPKFPCLLGKKLSTQLAKDTIPLPLGEKKFWKQTSLHLKLTCSFWAPSPGHRRSVLTDDF